MPRITRASTRARRERDDQSRLSTLLRAAEAAFIEEGYQGTTTDRIASRAGISVGTVYNLCGSKEKLYAAVARRIGEELLEYVNCSVATANDATEALELLVRFRLAGYDRQRLLLVLFSGERVVGATPAPESLPDDVRQLYHAYLDSVATVFARGMEHGVFARLHPLHLALGFEGMIGAFVGYWLARDQEAQNPSHARRLTETFLSIAGVRPPPEPAGPAPADSRQVFVTSFDISRLRELITVAKAFGDERSAAHLAELEAGLEASRIVEPTAVPRDVITMNSRFRLRSLPDGRTWVRSLVFPVDAREGAGSVSILTPLGTALLGGRVGAVVNTTDDGQPLRCEILELLYQPEAAGDFHR